MDWRLIILIAHTTYEHVLCKKTIRGSSYIQLLEMQQYTFWVYQIYRYITSFVSHRYIATRYSIAYINWFCRWTVFFQSHHVLYLSIGYRTVNLTHNYSISHNIVHIICSVKVNTWIYHAQYSIYANILSIQLN